MEKNEIEKAAVSLTSPSVWDLECSLRNGSKSKKDLPLLRAASDLANRRGSATMAKKLDARIRKIEKEEKS